MNAISACIACAAVLSAQAYGQGQTRYAWAVDAEDRIYTFNNQWSDVEGQ